MAADRSTADVARVFAGLKRFQRDSANYVFQRLYEDSDGTRRFLVADEAGLGKTHVARGVIAKAIAHLRAAGLSQINIVYICSNADIARQNIAKLGSVDSAEPVTTSRVTMLPVELKKLAKRDVNFVALTPGSSFDLQGSMGWWRERVVLYWMLRHALGLGDETGPKNLLQGDVGDHDWFRAQIAKSGADELDEGLLRAFKSALDRKTGISERFLAAAAAFRRKRRYNSSDQSRERRDVVSELRQLLASTCIRALKPDLVILDEFQRFKHLLGDQDEAAELAHELFDYSRGQSEARVLLLSATPYKMYTIVEESDSEDHYRDFIETLTFLHCGDEEASGRVAGLLKKYRQELYHLGGDHGLESLVSLKENIEKELLRVMVRSERLAVTEDHDDMLKSVVGVGGRVTADEVASFVSLNRVAEYLEAGDVLEYWKSSPFVLNFMDSYRLKRIFDDAADDPDRCAGLAEILAKSSGMLLSWRDVVEYRRIDPRNVRLADLLTKTVDRGSWRLLWLPPSLPYYEPAGPFAEPTLRDLTKYLVFSNWTVVPKVVASIVSYEAERQTARSIDPEARNTVEARRRRRPLLRFALAEGRLTGFPVLGLLYPSVTLARIGDPIALLDEANRERLASAEITLERLEEKVQQELGRLEQFGKVTRGAEDERWYWAAPMLMDFEGYGKPAQEWFDRPDLAAVWSGDRGDADEEGGESRWEEHIKAARDLISDTSSLGRPPADLVEVLACLALAGPAVAATRSLSGVTAGAGSILSVQVRDGAAKVAWAFRRLFNQPEATAVVRGHGTEGEPYWRTVLHYCVDGVLSAVLDEYAHMLKEDLGLGARPWEEKVKDIAGVMASVVALRTASLQVDEIRCGQEPDPLKVSRGQRMRSHFALRFGDQTEEKGGVIARKEQVRKAFNSPFWPFVLATTSIGQEGLDFHTYCHAVVHWNLPANPVDLEQREGRVHRYKCHAIRKNLAKVYGPVVANTQGGDPWALMFDAAHAQAGAGSRDLVPFWVFPLPEGAHIERYIPVVPLSRDLQRYEALRRSLAVYRMVFGQPRQDDLLAHLVERLDSQRLQEVAGQARIDLTPRSECGDGSST